MTNYKYFGSRCGCGEMTGHKTGLCAKCRLKPCEICGQDFEYKSDAQKRCVAHRHIKNREAYLNRQNSISTYGVRDFDVVVPAQPIGTVMGHIRVTVETVTDAVKSQPSQSSCVMGHSIGPVT